MDRAIEKRRALRHTRHFVLDDQCRRLVDAIYRFHCEFAEMGRPAVLPPSLQTGCCAADAEPVRNIFRFHRRTRRERLIGCQFIVRRDGTDGVSVVDIRISDAAAGANTEAGYHGQAIEVDGAMPAVVGNSRESHLLNMVGNTDRDFIRAKPGDLLDDISHPGFCQRTIFRCAAVLDQYHDGMAVGQRRAICKPAGIDKLANPDMTGVQEISGALDVDHASFQIVRYGRFCRSRLAVAQLVEYLVVFLDCLPESLRCRFFIRWCDRLRQAAFEVTDRRVPGDSLQRVRAQVIRPCFIGEKDHY